MFDSSSIVVGLEIGTSKICVVAGEVTAANNLNIIGLGQAKSRGVRKGEIADTSLASEDVRNAIVEAEQMANAEIRSVYLGVTGNHVRGFNNHGVHQIVSAEREITAEDVQDVIKNAKAINVPHDHIVIQAIRQLFQVDSQMGVQNPVGMYGTRVEVDMHVVHGHVNRLKNSVALVRGLGLQVEEIVFTGLASALALLSNEQKELGSLVIDLGAGVTNYVVAHGGIIKHTGVIAVGGDHISNDLVYGLKVPLGRAEQLKLERGGALIDDSIKGETISSDGGLGLPAKIINLEHLRRIMSLRLEETFDLIEAELSNLELLELLRAGVFLCGGGARIPGIQTMAEQIFQTPAFLGKTNSISSLKSALDQPEFTAAIGLVKFGSMQQKRKPALGFATAFKKTFVDMFGKGS